MSLKSLTIAASVMATTCLIASHGNATDIYVHSDLPEYDGKPVSFEITGTTGGTTTTICSGQATPVGLSVSGDLVPFKCPELDSFKGSKISAKITSPITATCTDNSFKAGQAEFNLIITSATACTIHKG
ncbi:MAG: hypothetical protein BGO67_12315 [Alphaproteobacteria bacterium 41-28]|nr:MAG: hypothetical protein BGO67_12315 [Alphaproteobacteria bacterium 41-28]